MLKLWMKLGSGHTTRFTLMDTLATAHEFDVRRVLSAIHHLTGSDYTSNVGTKYAELVSKPEHYLKNFSLVSTEEDMDNSLRAAEEYLVKVVRSASMNVESKTFDQLRFAMYHFNNSGIHDLPPTSASIRLHIQRAFYNTNLQLNCLNALSKQLNPLLFGYYEENGCLFPK
ncbi:uncharacterized protein LOC117173515 [Belonocnema kinseyi]|uniref:uncharacterized protein LOC117173515 n=1 Tax=Belonocnema kinseyi TaxID=2817044 RepID=UPI00143CC29A|nr:uncharacterized protein LOC117173515 [Belonocnema kinseyi]